MKPRRQAAPPVPSGGPLAPAWGWRLPQAGRAAHVAPGAEFQATTVQACGLYPFVAGAGAPVLGTPVGRHQLHGEVVCLDPLAWLRAGLVTNPGMFLLGQPGSGKALDVSTPVPVPGGWATMGQLTLGDYVFGADGRPVPVIAVSGVMTGRPCLQVTFDDASMITADASHEWVTVTTGQTATVPAGPSGQIPGGSAAIRTTRDIMATLSGPGGGPAHLIAAPAALQLTAADLPGLPYQLGARLAGAVIPDGGASRSGAAGGCRHIPGRWLRGSPRQRRGLLAGLLATAGTPHGPGVAAFTTVSGQLARDVHELACTLGHPAALHRDPDGWTVLIPSAGPVAWRRITAVRPVASRPVRCIQVASGSGMFLAGRSLIPTHNSTLVKRLATGAVARGETTLILGDPRPDYTALTEALGGQVIRVGRGMDRLNPLDTGPLGAVLPRLPAAEAAQMRAEARARRLALVMALCTLIRGTPLGNDEEVILGRAIDLLDERHTDRAQPAVPDVLRILEEGPDGLRSAARADDPARYRERVAPLTFTLDLLLTGTLAGAFDQQTTRPIDLASPMVSVDISRAGAAGDKLLTAAMLSTWAYGFSVVDAAAALAALGIAPRRSYLAVMDELWRALRGAPGLVEHADALTRLNRAKGMASIMITHSLADLDALPTEEDRAKARGFMERSAISVLAALPPRELAKVSAITPLTGPERDLVASWSAPDSWQPGGRHPGRGKYLIKTGGRLGIPVEMSLAGAERDLYDTDQAIRACEPGKGQS